MSGPVNKFHGPFNPQISPDGTKVAYEYFNDSYDTAPGCTDTTVPPCFAYKQSQGVLVSDTTGYTGFEKYGLMTGWIWPQWIDNTTLLRSDPSLSPNDDAVITPLGGANDNWFYDPNQGLGVANVELSRDLTTVVGIAGFSDEKLRVYRTTMSPFGAPDWDHTPFTNHENVPRRPAVLRAAGHEVHQHVASPRPATALVYGTKDGLYVSRDRRRLRARADAARPRRDLARLGPGRRPAPTATQQQQQQQNGGGNGPGEEADAQARQEATA